MTLKDLINNYDENTNIIFEYCYLDENLKPYKDINLSYEGKAKDFIHTIKDKTILNLYPTCGESYDFEIIKNKDCIILRYIDFR